MNEVIECVMDTVREMYKGVFEKDEGRKVRVDFVFKLYNTKKTKKTKLIHRYHSNGLNKHSMHAL